MIICWNCGTENETGTKHCVKCNVALGKYTPATRTFEDTDYEEGVPRWGSAKFNRAMDLILQVQNTQQEFSFDAGQIDELVMGRVDPDTGEAPSVDLTDSDAMDKGVSRRHATIERRDGALHIVDNGSANGTFLNGQRLVAHQPRILRDGDDIRLGHLTVRVTFKVRTP